MHGPCFTPFSSSWRSSPCCSSSSAAGASEPLPVSHFIRQPLDHPRTFMSTTLPSQLLGSVASAAGSGLDAAGQLVADASHLVADATESLGDIAGAAIDVGGSAAGVIADSTVRGARKAMAPHRVWLPRQASPGTRCLWRGGPRDLLRPRRRRRHSGNDATGYVDRPVPRKVSAVGLSAIRDPRHNPPTRPITPSRRSGTTRTPAPSEDERVVPRLTSTGARPGE